MKLLSKCPACNGALKVRVLQCSDCGLELKNDFELSPFDGLNDEQNDFLLCFLRCRGNMSLLQNELNLSYAVAKRRLSELLVILGIAPDEQDNNNEGVIDVSNWITNSQSTKASEIIKTRLKESGGRAIVTSINGKTYEIIAEADGNSFFCSALPVKPNYTYAVFDVIVDLLLSQNGKAKKGFGRNAKLGEPKCEETTVVGAIGKNYAGHKPGDSVYDPVFVLSAVLDWAGIVHNERGYLELTAGYRSQLQ